jgi:putative ABC transport system permease protein
LILWEKYSLLHPAYCQPLKTKAMLLSYLKVIFRNFFSDGMYTPIIVFGLAVGIAVSLIIGQYIYFELSFDKQYKDRDRIYYTYMRWNDAQGVYDKLCHPAISPFIKHVVPEVESSIRITPAGINLGDEWVLQREKDGKKKEFGRINNMYRADPEIFDFFSIPMLAGDPKTALVDPGSIVITRSVANKFFPNESAMDQILKVLIWDFKVTGIIEDAAPNSSLQYNVFFPLNGMPKESLELWEWPEFQTFIKLRPGTEQQAIEEKINNAAAPHLSQLQKQFNIDESIHLHPFQDFHFYKPYNNAGVSPVVFTGDKRIIGFFAAIALLILTICWSNYINLTVARALRRAKEVGLRKVSGAGRSNLVLQFLSEFLFLNMISLLVAFTITQLLFDSFASAIGSMAEWMLWKEPLFWLVIIAFIIISTLVSGMYPSLVMANYNPAKVLKGNFSRSQSGMNLRRALVFVQFGLSALLLMSIYVVSRQLVFMQTKDIGMSTEQVLVVRLDDLDPALSRFTAFDQWMSRIQNKDYFISGAAISDYPGGRIPRGGYYYRVTDPQKTTMNFEQNGITQDYFKTMNIQILYGRSFRNEYPGDSSNVVVNESAMHQFGFDNPESALGQEIVFAKSNKAYKIIGIAKDFSSDLRYKPYNSIFHHKDAGEWGVIFVIKLSTTNLSVTMSDLQKEWQTLFNDSPFDYFFLDTYFDTFYKEERQFASVFGFFSIVGVVITCMGLFGLSMYNTNSRTKEIGIRKSLGASSRGIMWLFSKEYLNLVLAASIVCLPIGAWLLKDWLKNYPNRIDFGVDFIIVPLILMTVVAQFTVGYQTFKAAHSNPVDSLRSE